MSTPTLNSLFERLQQSMISNDAFSDVLNHPGDKGNNTEANWIDWLRQYLPKRYCVDKATIIDSHNNVSDQIDVVIYDSQYSYLVLNHNHIKYLPAESVYAVFEIKPNLNKSHLDYAAHKAESVRKLYRTSASIPHAGGVYPPKPLHNILAGILTNRIDWATNFGKPFKSALTSYSADQQIDLGCVLEYGGFHYLSSTPSHLRTCPASQSLVWFFLELLLALRNIGTAPAIDFAEYMQNLSTSEENI